MASGSTPSQTLLCSAAAQTPARSPLSPWVTPARLPADPRSPCLTATAAPAASAESLAGDIASKPARMPVPWASSRSQPSVSAQQAWWQQLLSEAGSCQGQVNKILPGLMANSNGNSRAGTAGIRSMQRRWNRCSLWKPCKKRKNSETEVCRADQSTGRS